MEGGICPKNAHLRTSVGLRTPGINMTSENSRQRIFGDKTIFFVTETVLNKNEILPTQKLRANVFYHLIAYKFTIHIIMFTLLWYFWLFATVFHYVFYLKYATIIENSLSSLFKLVSSANTFPVFFYEFRPQSSEKFDWSS